MQKILDVLNEAKMIIGTIAIVASSLIGTYTFLDKTFVTKTFAKTLEEQYSRTITNIDLDTQYNKLQIIQMKLLRLQNASTPIEVELRKTLLKQEKRVQDKIYFLEDK